MLSRVTNAQQELGANYTRKHTPGYDNEHNIRPNQTASRSTGLEYFTKKGPELFE
jgi:hypothetical protein